MMTTKVFLCIFFFGLVCIVDKAFAPFPREDPRSVLNPLIIPWWIYTPCRTRKAIHQVRDAKMILAKKKIVSLYF